MNVDLTNSDRYITIIMLAISIEYMYLVPFYLEYKYNRITKVPQRFHCVTGLKPNSVLSIQVNISSNIQMAAKDNYLPCKHD